MQMPSKHLWFIASSGSIVGWLPPTNIGILTLFFLRNSANFTDCRNSVLLAEIPEQIVDLVFLRHLALMGGRERVHVVGDRVDQVCCRSGWTTFGRDGSFHVLVVSGSVRYEPNDEKRPEQQTERTPDCGTSLLTSHAHLKPPLFIITRLGSTSNCNTLR